MKQKKLYELEFLRGIAAVIVVFWHFLLGFHHLATGFFDKSTGLIGTPFFFIINGSGSVTFFYVLSGFILTFRYFQSPNKTSLIRNAAKRFFRLTGPVALIILVSYTLYKLNLYFFYDAATLSGSDWLKAFGYSSRGFNLDFTVLDVIKNVFFSVVLNGDQYFNSNLWTMKYEFYGSLFSFAIAPTLIYQKPKLSKVQFYIALIAVIIITHFIKPYYNCFLLGTLLAYYNSKKTISVNMKNSLFIIFFSILLLSYYTSTKFYSFLSVTNINNEHLRIYFNSLASLGIIYVVLGNKKIATSLSHKFGKFLGQLSFPIYLIHPLLFFSFSSWFYIEFYDKLNQFQLLVTTFILTIIILIPLSYLITLFDEYWVKKINRVFKRLIKDV